jgi:hypothetical protein
LPQLNTDMSQDPRSWQPHNSTINMQSALLACREQPPPGLHKPPPPPPPMPTPPATPLPPLAFPLQCTATELSRAGLRTALRRQWPPGAGLGRAAGLLQASMHLEVRQRRMRCYLAGVRDQRRSARCRIFELCASKLWACRFIEALHAAWKAVSICNYCC